MSTPVRHTAPVTPRFDIEQITNTAGCRLTGGSGASCWGYNQSNIVRAGQDVYALSWRDDLSLVVYRRVDPGTWEASDPLPPVPQNGNLLVDPQGRVHVIGGANGGWHALFDPPAQVRRCEIRSPAEADSRFGAAMDEDGRILVVGGLASLAWYVLDPAEGYACAASGSMSNPANRGYHFVVFSGGSAHTYCSDDYFLPGDEYPNQSVTTRDLTTDQISTVETPHGIYPVLKSYLHEDLDLLSRPDDWRVSTISDVSSTFVEGARGTTEQQDLLLDRQGLLHLVYFANREPSREVWAGTGQDQRNSRLSHRVGPPGGPFEAVELGRYNSGRLYESLDGRMHYLLTRGRRGDAESLWYARSEPGCWDTMSEPVELPMPGRFWHVFTNTLRAGGTQTTAIDCYWTGASRGKSNEVWYGCLVPPG